MAEIEITCFTSCGDNDFTNKRREEIICESGMHNQKERKYKKNV